jgi:hypothetical protein
MQRQVDSQPEHGRLPILLLAAPLAGLAFHTRWLVSNNDRRFHLVAMLPARTSPAASTDLAFRQELLDGNGGWVNLSACHSYK